MNSVEFFGSLVCFFVLFCFVFSELLAATLIFLKNIFDLQSVESTDAEPMDMEG